MLVMCFLKRQQKQENTTKVRRKYFVLLAALVSAIPALVGFNSREISLIKLFLFPLVFRCLWGKAFEMGVPCFKTPGVGGIFGYVAVGSLIGYSFWLEPWSNNPSMNKMVMQYTNFPDSTRLGHVTSMLYFRVLHGDLYHS